MKFLKPYLLIVFALSAFALTACGQTGDLYLPEDDAAAKKQQEQK